MGLATIDSHSNKVQTKLHKIPKFGVNRPTGKIYREMHGSTSSSPYSTSESTSPVGFKLSGKIKPRTSGTS